MPEAAELDDARRASAKRDWRAAASGFERAREVGPLGPDDLALWSRSAWWLGLPAQSVALAEESFAGFRDAGRREDAAQTALRVSLLRLTGGDVTLGTAWMRRARALLHDRPDGVLQAYLIYLETSAGLLSDGGDAWSAESVARLRDLAQRLPDQAVAALSLVVAGMADLRAGETARGFAQLDEAMLGVLADEIEPEWGGDIFCTTIHACHELADYQRMADWTQATEEWCRQFGSDAIYAGVCRVHRLELRSAAGDWDSVEDALVSEGPLTAPELARYTSTAPRYAREWLEQQATFGVVEVVGAVDVPADARRYELPAGAAEVLADRSSLAYTAPLARMLAASGAQMPALIEAYRTGGGVSWDQLGVHARESQADMNRPWLDTAPSVFARHPHVHERLSRPGARVADIAMGEGWSSIALARAYPRLQVDGFDVDAPSVQAARSHAEAAGVADRVRFHVEDAANLAAHGRFDAAVGFEFLHDLPHPQAVLTAMNEATGDDGIVVIMDEAVGDEFTPNTEGLDRVMYGFSLFICLPDGLSHQPSAATGTVMRPSTLRRYAGEAGFARVDVLEDGFGFWRFYELVRS
ncbi:class I SAM-dependent methyltransferase [Agromyces bauzanensis]